MGNRTSTTVTRLLAGLALAAGAALALSPRLRAALTEMVSQGMRSVQEAARPRFGGRRYDLSRVSTRFDQAVPQMQSVMTVSKVESALAREPRLRERKVRVQIIGGVVHLEGEVPSQEEKVRAGEVAMRAIGSEVIANDLKVTSPTP